MPNPLPPLAVLGAGGHALVVVAMLRQLGYPLVAALDLHPEPSRSLLGVPVVAEQERPAGVPLVLAIGDNQRRQELYQQLRSELWHRPLIHPTACVSTAAQLEETAILLAGCHVGPLARVAANCIINTRAVVEHEAEIGAHCHLAVGATLLGGARIGEGCFIGAGAVIRDGISIVAGTTIGANSYVHRTIDHPGVYGGVPARRLG